MKLARITAWLLALIILLGATALLSAEEITLKDGQKIIGTIVGYEQDMFRVETDYGIALVRKDKVLSIQVSKPGPAASTQATPITPTRKPADVKAPQTTTPPTPSPVPAIVPPATQKRAPVTTSALPNAQFPGPNVVKPDPITPQTLSPSASAGPPTVSPSRAPNPAVNAPNPAPPPAPSLTSATLTAKPPEPTPVAAKPAAPPVPAKPPAPPPPPVSHPIDTPLPGHIEEHLDGNTYFNDTFHFSMFKPPDWKIFEGVPKETGTGIMAIGSEDEQTVLIVDRQMWSGTPRLSGDEVEAKFRQTYQDYRQLSQEPIQCDGRPATRRTFTGVLDGVVWYGVVVHVVHGNTVFGIIGVTSAETFGFQEAIFNKIAKSFHFLAPQ